MKRFIMFFLLLSSTAYGHAYLDHAEPKVGSTVSQSPEVVKVWFSESVEPAFSTLEVKDASGNRIDQKDTHLDDKDDTLLIVSLSKLATGTYTVAWKVVAKDTHRTHGEFQFTVTPKS